jgi:hypothetical protein
MAKMADFGEEFMKMADFILANRGLTDLLLALEEAPADQAESLPEIRRQAQRTRHMFETFQADCSRLVEQVRSRNGQAPSRGSQDVHVHVHLHLNTDNGSLTSRVER